MEESVGKKFIKESDKEQEKWYKQCREQTFETLPFFCKKLMDDYSHDMMTVVHALTAGALAAICAMNNHPEGDIGPEQAHALLGQFIKRWGRIEGKVKLWSWAGLLHPDNKGPLFTVPDDVAAELVGQAKELLEKRKDMSQNEREHLLGIVEGEFPWGFHSKKKAVE